MTPRPPADPTTRRRPSGRRRGLRFEPAIGPPRGSACLAACWLGLLLLVAPVASGGETYDFAGSRWAFSAPELRLKLQLEGSPRSKEQGTPPATLTVGTEDASLVVDGLPLLTGTLQQASPTARRLDLLPQDASALAGWLDARLAASAAQQGLVASPSTAQFDSSRVRLKLRIHRSEAQVSGRLVVNLRASGTLLAAAGDGSLQSLGWKANLRLAGTSERLPAAGIVVVPQQEQEPPLAGFSMSTSIGAAPLTVVFHSQSEGTITQFAWDFGDGASTSYPDPVYVFETPGTYLVTLQVQGPLGTDSVSRFVTALDGPTGPGSGPPPRMNLYPSSPGDLTYGFLEKQLGPGSMFWVGMTPGFAWEFTGILDGTMSAAQNWNETLVVSSDIPQQLDSYLVLKRPGAETSEIFPVKQFTVGASTPGQIEYITRSVQLPPISTKPGDRLVWVIDNVSDVDGPVADLRIYLDRSRLRVPKY